LFLSRLQQIFAGGEGNGYFTFKVAGSNPVMLVQHVAQWQSKSTVPLVPRRRSQSLSLAVEAVLRD
jgi:hypothetical protein